jgi:hypothetical protein
VRDDTIGEQIGNKTVKTDAKSIEIARVKITEAWQKALASTR